jgi:threonylcarbamoyladenosine tRNA methylthiotransferase MtaB
MNLEKPVKFIIHTIGCKTNQAESDDIARQLVLRGCRQAEIADTSGDTDYIIINTCTVTSAADRKTRHLIRKLRSASPKSKLIVTGCFAELNREFLEEIFTDFIFSNNKKNEIADLICNADYVKEKPISATTLDPSKAAVQTDKSGLETAAAATATSGKAVADAAESGKAVADAAESEPAAATAATAAEEPRHVHSRAFVKIQDGCRQGCSYCIVPLARGPYLSTDPEKIIDDIKNLVYQGHDEIVLTGIHIGKFGVDLISKKTAIKTLPELVLEIIKNTGLKRLRLSSIEINEIDESLIGVIRNNMPAIVPHLHIPLQSGSDNVLKAMNRKYDSGFFISAVEHIKKTIPDITITTDIIVGFPGETDEDFIKTVEMVKNINFSRLHVFKYSKRSGTKAADMTGHLQEKVKTERSRILRELGSGLRNRFVASNITKKLDVICEEYDMKSGIAGGTSENYIKVYFDLNFEEYKLKKGKIFKVFTKSLYADGLFGEVI